MKVTTPIEAGTPSASVIATARSHVVRWHVFLWRNACQPRLSPKPTASISPAGRMMAVTATNSAATMVSTIVRDNVRLRYAAIPALADQTSAHIKGTSLSTRAA